MVSKAKVDFPLPERPVITVSFSRGISTSMFFKLCIRAPLTLITEADMPNSLALLFRSCKALHLQKRQMDMCRRLLSHQVAVGLQVFFALEQVIEKGIAKNEERNHKESEIHFQHDIESSVKHNRDGQAFGDFFVGEYAVAFEVKNRVNGVREKSAFFAHFFGPNRIREVGDSVVISVNSGE